MRIIDAGGADARGPPGQGFRRRRHLGPPFGWNLPNWLLRREMVARLAELPNVSFRPGIGFARMLTRDAEALVTLTDGAQVAPGWSIGADGRTSPVREALGIGVTTIRYGQKALAFAVTHDHARTSNVSTEVHRSGGPFTLVPLPDRDGRPASAVVWMETGPEVARLAALPVAEFEAEMTARSSGILGPLTLLTPPLGLADHQPDRRPDVRPPHRPDGRGRACRAAHRRAGAEHEPGRPALPAGPGPAAPRRSRQCRRDRQPITAAATGRCRPASPGSTF